MSVLVSKCQVRKTQLGKGCNAACHTVYLSWIANDLEMCAETAGVTLLVICSVSYLNSLAAVFECSAAGVWRSGASAGSGSRMKTG